jgi:hypothetical protein
MSARSAVRRRSYRVLSGLRWLRTGAFIWSHVMGRSEPGIWKNSKRVGPISGRSRRVGCGEGVEAGLVFPHREGPERLAGELGIKRVPDHPAGACQLAADGHGITQEAGDRAAASERQPRGHRQVRAAGVNRLSLGPGQGRHGTSSERVI